jgi:hypothetical protein
LSWSFVSGNRDAEALKLRNRYGLDELGIVRILAKYRPRKGKPLQSASRLFLVQRRSAWNDSASAAYRPAKAARWYSVKYGQIEDLPVSFI